MQESKDGAREARTASGPYWSYFTHPRERKSLYLTISDYHSPIKILYAWAKVLPTKEAVGGVLQLYR